MPPARPSELLALAERINAMTPPQRLRLAADLMECGRGDTAALIIRRISDELQLALLLYPRKPKAI